MNGIKTLQTALEGTRALTNWFISDLSDADLFVRPAPGANHIAWQMGNIIVGDKFLVESQIPGASYPELPAGFAELHGKEGASNDGPDGFLTKAGYVELFDKVRAATIAEVGKLTDADLDRPTTGSLASFAPTLGQMILLVSNHALLHAGQFSVIRRVLGKPVLF